MELAVAFIFSEFIWAECSVDSPLTEPETVVQHHLPQSRLNSFFLVSAF